MVTLPINSYAGQAIQEVDLFGTYGTQWRIQCRALAAVRPRKVQNTLYILIRNACQMDIQPHIDRRCARWTKVGLSPDLIPGLWIPVKTFPNRSLFVANGFTFA